MKQRVIPILGAVISGSSPVRDHTLPTNHFEHCLPRNMEAVTVSFTESATKSLLGKLGSILAQEAELLDGVADEARYIIDEMESMTSLLRVMSSRQDHDEQVKTWMKQVREMAYDTEDSIDVFKHHLGRCRQESRIIIDFLADTVHLLRRLKARHDVATDLQKLKLQACHVSERQVCYSIKSGGATGAPNVPDLSRSVPPGEVRPESMGGDELLGWLMDVK